MKNIAMVYKCTQQELYSIAETAIANLEHHLPTFSKYKRKYNQAFVAAIKKLRQDAIDLPTHEQRSAINETLRVQMVPYADECLRNFLFLKGYINDAFPESVRKIKYNTAGQGYYDKASKGNWEYLSGLCVAMDKFIAENTATLTANDNMPETFVAEVITASNHFSEKYSAFKTARQSSSTTATKIAANNDLYRKMMDFMEEGKLLFADKEEMKKLFTFNVLKSLISPPGSASLKVILKNNDSSAAADIDVTIKLSDGNGPTMRATSDEKGEAIFNGINTGVYEVNVDFAPVQNYLKEVNTGVAARLEVVKSSLVHSF